MDAPPKWVVIAGALALIIITIPVYLKLGSNSCPSGRGLHPLHAHHHAGDLLTEAQKILQVTTGSSSSSRRWTVCWQGGPRRDIDRPCAALHAGDGDHPQAKSEWRRAATWYSSWARNGLIPSTPLHAGSHLPGGSD